MQFTLQLKRNNLKLLVKVTWIWYFILLALIVLFAFSSTTTDKQQIRLLIRVAVLIGGGILYRYLQKQQPHTFKSFQLAIFFFSVISIFNFFGIYFTICFALFALFIYWFAQQKTTISFSSSCILIKNGISKRVIDWDTLNNAILKDDVLTIDFKNDKLIQEEIEPTDNIKELNEFLVAQFK